MARIGWISVHRQIQDHWLWEDKPFTKGQAWIDLLLSASHCDKKFLLGNELVEVKTGSFITSISKLCEKWGWSNTKVVKFLDMLEAEKMITRKSDTKKTAITIENYSTYQDCGNEKTTQERYGDDTETMRKHTINNSNNSNNELIIPNNNIGASKDAPKSDKKRFVKPTLEEVTEYCNSLNSSVDPQAFIDYYDSNGWRVGKNPMKDWRATLRNWHRKDAGSKKTTEEQYGDTADDWKKFFGGE